MNAEFKYQNKTKQFYYSNWKCHEFEKFENCVWVFFHFLIKNSNEETEKNNKQYEKKNLMSTQKICIFEKNLTYSC